MGMYDSLYCQIKLRPIRVNEYNVISFGSNKEFQTKDLLCLLDSYIISSDRRLKYMELARRDESLILCENYKDMEFHGMLNFYTTHKIDDEIYFVDFYAMFDDGNLVTIDHSVSKY